MAYRRKHSMARSSTFEEYRSAAAEEQPSSPSSLAAQAIRASSAHRDSSLSSAYGESAFSSAYREPNRQMPPQNPQDPTAYEYTSMKSLNETKYGFWGVLARKAKSILEEDNVARQFEDHGRNRSQIPETSTGGQFHQSHRSPESYQKTDNPTFHKGSDIASSLNYIGGTIRNALEEGLTIVENRTADIIQETRKLQIRRKSGGSSAQNQATDISEAQQSQSDQETQLKASRDVANAMAAKAKLLLRELKTVKADLAFAKERCAQLEEENKMLRESRQKGDHHEDDDLIRLQLETLLAEKGRLAHENSVYARENRFLREIVEYHQLTMQDVVYLDEGSEEVTEVCPRHIPNSHHSPPHSAPEDPSPIPSSPTTPTSAKSSTPPSPDPVDRRLTIPAPPAPPPLVLTKPVTAEASPSPSPSQSPTAEATRRRLQGSPTPP